MAPIVSRPPRGAVRTWCTSSAMGLATIAGQAPKISFAASSARLCVPKNPASAVRKIRNGKSEVRVDSAIWLAIAQPSSAENRHRASRRTAKSSPMPRRALIAAMPKSSTLASTPNDRRRPALALGSRRGARRLAAGRDGASRKGVNFFWQAREALELGRIGPGRTIRACSVLCLARSARGGDAISQKSGASALFSTSPPNFGL